MLLVVEQIGTFWKLQIASYSATHLSIAMSSDQRCFVWGQLSNGTSISTPWELPPFYNTVESPLSFFSTIRKTPHSVSLPAKECHGKTDSTTQTEQFSYSVLDQTLASSNKILNQMFDNPESSSDVRFLVEEQTILAHRSVLQISSGHFRQLFSSHSAYPNPTPHSDPSCANPSELNPDTTPPGPQGTISISDHSYPSFYAYLRFLYLDNLEVSPEHLADLFSLSVAYLESDLQQLCLSRMRTTLTPANCCPYYLLTHRYALPELEDFQKEVVQFISTNFFKVIATDAYQSMDSDLCKKLTISMANLNTC